LNGRVDTAHNSHVNGVKDTLEHSGVVWSAVTNDLGTGIAGLAILISNLGRTTTISISFNTRINNATLRRCGTVSVVQVST